MGKVQRDGKAVFLIREQVWTDHDCRWYVKGPGLVVQFVQVCAGHKWLPVDLGYHANVAMWQGQKGDFCDLLPGGMCYYDGSGLTADIVGKGLRENGAEWVWEYLERYWEDRDAR